MLRAACPDKPDAKLLRLSQALAPNLRSMPIWKQIRNLRRDAAQFCAKYPGEAGQRNIKVELAGDLIFRHHTRHAGHCCDHGLQLVAAFDDDLRAAFAEQRCVSDELNCVPKTLFSAQKN